MSSFRPEYVEALRLLARASNDMAARDLPRPILVGGGAVEYYTAGHIPSGDFDLVEPYQDELEEALIRQGFERPSGPGQLTRGLVHRKLGIGVEVVSGQLMDGLANSAYMRLIPTDDGEIAVIGIEDLISDRIGQYFSTPSGVPEMLAQATELLIVAKALDDGYDRDYLDRRIREETAEDCSLEALEQMIDARSRQ